jgi:hypothetical protein
MGEKPYRRFSYFADSSWEHRKESSMFTIRLSTVSSDSLLHLTDRLVLRIMHICVVKRISGMTLKQRNEEFCRIEPLPSECQDSIDLH